MTRQEKAQVVRAKIKVYQRHLRELARGAQCDPAGCPCGGLGELALEMVPPPRTMEQLADFYDFAISKKLL